MPFDIYTTHNLIAAVEQILPLHTFLRDRYFPTNDAADLFSTEDVLVDYKDGENKLAPFVAPRKGGVTVLRDGYTTERYTPPYIAPRRPLTADDLSKRGFGEALFSKLTPAQREGALAMKDMDEMGQMISRREEAMAADTLFTNGCVMRHIIDDTGKYEEKEIRFYEGASNPAQYTPSTKWNATGADIIADCAAVCALLQDKGLPATDLVVAPDVAVDILNDDAIKELLDLRNYNIGGIDPQPLPNGATRLGRLNCQGTMLDVIVYRDKYTNDSGVATQYIPAGKAVITAPGCGRTMYGAVTQLEQSDGQFHTYTGKRIPKYIANAENETRSLTLKARPLLVPNNKDAWYVINAH